MYTMIIVIVILMIVVGVVFQVLFWGLLILGLAKLTGKIAKDVEEFQAMPNDKKLQTLMMLQRYRQFDQARSYMGSVQGPVESEIRGMAAQEGISLDF